MSGPSPEDLIASMGSPRFSRGHGAGGARGRGGKPKGGKGAFQRGNTAGRKAPRQKNKLVPKYDALARRTRDEKGRIATEYLPIPPDAAADALLAGMAPKECLAALQRRDIDRAAVRRVWDRLEALAEGGNMEAIKYLCDRWFGRPVKTVGVMTVHKHMLDPAAEQLLDALTGRLAGPPRELVEGAAA